MANLPFWMQLLAFAAPTLLVALVGVVLGLVTLRRCQQAALMALVGCGLLFLVGFFAFLGRTVIWEQMRDGAIPPQRSGELMALVGVASGLGHALGLLLIVSAVFVGRAPQPDATADENY